MPSNNPKALIFHLAGNGFVIDLQHVVEVFENLADLLDVGRSDLKSGIVAALNFRHTWIPAVDPTLELALVSSVLPEQRAALILRGSEGNWAILVDRVGSLVTIERPTFAVLPMLLRVSAAKAYQQVLLADEVPFVVFEPERFYGMSRDCT